MSKIGFHTCEFPGVVRDIARALGDDWQAAPIEPVREGDDDVARRWKFAHQYLIHKPDGMRLLLHYEEYGARAYAKPHVPAPRETEYRNLRSYGLWDKNSDPETSFVPTRPAASIAKQIKRAVIDPYAQLYPSVIERLNNEQQNAERVQTLAARLADLLQTEPERYKSWRQEQRIYAALKQGKVSAEVTVYSDSVSLTLRGMAPDMAIRLAQWLSVE